MRCKYIPNNFSRITDFKLFLLKKLLETSYSFRNYFHKYIVMPFRTNFKVTFSMKVLNCEINENNAEKADLADFLIY